MTGAAITALLNISSVRLADLFFVLVGFELAPYLALRWALHAPGIVLCNDKRNDKHLFLGVTWTHSPIPSVGVPTELNEPLSHCFHVSGMRDGEALAPFLQLGSGDTLAMTVILKLVR